MRHGSPLPLPPNDHPILAQWSPGVVESHIKSDFSTNPFRPENAQVLTRDTGGQPGYQEIEPGTPPLVRESM